LAAAVVTTALGAWFWRVRGRPEPSPASAVRIVPFTTDGGLKLSPRLSPDGERVAYAWAGVTGDNWDIYVKAIGPGTKPLRLTESASSERSPVWSPDGREIAFLR
jgi:Tol biopolymer transport system component